MGNGTGNWQWSEQAVDRSKKHIELRFGDARVSAYEDWVPVAVVGPPKGSVFPVQWIIDVKTTENAQIIEAGRKELDFYLIELNEPDPWEYAIYHCNTAANMYSRIHWSYFTKGFSSRRLSSMVVRVVPPETAAASDTGTIDVQSLTSRIGDLLKNCDLPSSMKSEIDLERYVRPIVRSCVKEALQISDEELSDVVFSHGEIEAERAYWTKSKAYQNVVVYGCSNTSDIFIRLPNDESIYMEIKLSKKRGPGGSTLPGDIQRSIGQSLIASLRHPYVICFIVCEADLRNKPEDLREKLQSTLWERHRIALIVRHLS